LGKMGEVSKGEGRTVLFVSHNMVSVKALCSKGVLMETGGIRFSGMADDVIRTYMGGDKSESNHRQINHEFEGFYIKDISVFNPDFGVESPVYRDKAIWVKINYENKTNLNNLYFNFKFKDDEGRYFLVTASSSVENIIQYGIGSATMKIPTGFFNEGVYAIELMVIQHENSEYKTYFHEPDLLHFQILPEKRDVGSWMGKEVGYIRHTFEWTK